MRQVSKWMLTLGLAAICVAPVMAQRQPGGGGFGGGFGGIGGGTNPASMLRNPAIAKELGLKEEQTDKLDAAMWEAVAKVLDEKQMARLKGIYVQQRGTAALNEEWVQKAIGLTSAQVKSMEAIKSEVEKETKEMMEKLRGGGQGGFNRDAFTKLRSLRTESEERIKELLTSTQKRRLEELQGEEFKMGRGGFGGGRPGQGGGRPGAGGGQGGRPGAGGQGARPGRPGGNGGQAAPRRIDTNS